MQDPKCEVVGNGEQGKQSRVWGSGTRSASEYLVESSTSKSVKEEGGNLGGGVTQDYRLPEYTEVELGLGARMSDSWGQTFVQEGMALGYGQASFCVLVEQG